MSFEVNKKCKVKMFLSIVLLSFFWEQIKKKMKSAIKMKEGVVTRF